MEALADPLTHPEINQELRVRTDTTTWLAETLHGSMRTNFEFNYDGQELRSEDGSSLNDIFDESVAEAKVVTEWNPSMLFELRRRLIERDELNDMYKMINGELPNTMVVISDFPPELADATKDVGGYNASRQQTMMRVITLGENGKLRITTQSLDGSNRQALEAIYASMGEPVQEGELLSQRINRQLPEEWQDQVADNLTKVYDGSLTQQQGGEWHAGISQRPDRNMVNTYDFVLGQTDLIEWFVAEKIANPAGAEKVRYKLAATASARHERHLKSQYGNRSVLGTVTYRSVVSAENIIMHRGLQAELNREEKRAASRGEIFSGCGTSVKFNSNELSDELSGESQASDLGYARGRRGKKCEYISKKCPKCDKKNVKTTETDTHISGDCGCSTRKKQQASHPL